MLFTTYWHTGLLQHTTIRLALHKWLNNFICVYVCMSTSTQAHTLTSPRARKIKRIHARNLQFYDSIHLPDVIRALQHECTCVRVHECMFAQVRACMSAWAHNGVYDLSHWWMCKCMNAFMSACEWEVWMQLYAFSNACMNACMSACVRHKNAMSGKHVSNHSLSQQRLFHRAYQIMHGG